jgi:hypothetical protein
VTESITVCENLIRDFSWLPGFLEYFASLVAGFGPVLALWGAVYLYFKRQEAERNAARADRNALVAEETLIAVHEFDVALREIRAQRSEIPPEVKNRRGYQWNERLARMSAREAEYEKLRQMEVRARAFLGNESVNGAIGELFGIWRTLRAALDSLRRADEDTHDQELRKFYSDLRKQAWGSYSDEDDLGRAQTAAINTLQRELYPIVRLALASP